MKFLVFTTVPGLKREIGEHGEATNKRGVAVPEAVARQIEDEIRGEKPNPHFGKFWCPRTARHFASAEAAAEFVMPDEDEQGRDERLRGLQEETERVLKYAQKNTQLRVERVEDKSPEAPKPARATRVAEPSVAPKSEEK